MDCSLVKRNLSAFIDKELDDTKSGIVQQHLETCPECRDHLREFGALDGLVHGLPKIDPAPDFASMVVRSAMSASSYPKATPLLSRMKTAADRISDFVFTLFEGEARLSTRALDEFDDCPPLSMSFAYFKLLNGVKGY